MSATPCMAGNPMRGAAAGRVGGDLLKPQTTAQILRCFDLGGYTATVEGGELKVCGPQPLAGPVPGSVEANREEIINFLSEWCGGAWPPAKEPVSGLRELEEFLDCGLAEALDVVEAAERRAA